MADLRYEPFAAGVTDHLEERRLAAIEQKAEAELAAGPGYELGSELEQLVGDHPTRERMVALLMLALYRAGRQSDALAAMQVAGGIWPSSSAWSQGRSYAGWNGAFLNTTRRWPQPRPP